MNRKKRVVFLAIAVIAVVALLAVILGMQDKAAYVEEVSSHEVDEAFELLNDSLSFETVRYQEYIAGQEIVYGLEDAVGEPSDSEKENGYDAGVVNLDYQEAATYTVNVKESGVYSLGLDYHTGGTNLSDYRIA